MQEREPRELREVILQHIYEPRSTNDPEDDESQAGGEEATHYTTGHRDPVSFRSITRARD